MVTAVNNDFDSMCLFEYAYFTKLRSYTYIHTYIHVKLYCEYSCMEFLAPSLCKVKVQTFYHYSTVEL